MSTKGNDNNHQVQSEIDVNTNELTETCSNGGKYEEVVNINCSINETQTNMYNENESKEMCEGNEIEIIHSETDIMKSKETVTEANQISEITETAMDNESYIAQVCVVYISYILQNINM